VGAQCKDGRNHTPQDHQKEGKQQGPRQETQEGFIRQVPQNRALLNVFLCVPTKTKQKKKTMKEKKEFFCLSHLLYLFAFCIILD
jgi:hypothetical protein